MLRTQSSTCVHCGRLITREVVEPVKTNLDNIMTPWLHKTSPLVVCDPDAESITRAEPIPKIYNAKVLAAMIEAAAFEAAGGIDKIDEDPTEPDWTGTMVHFLADVVVEACATMGYSFTGWGLEAGARWLIFGEDFEYEYEATNREAQNIPKDKVIDPMVANDHGGVASLHRELIDNLRNRGWIK